MAVYKTCFKVAALFGERSGRHWVRTAYVYETTFEKAREVATRTFKGAKAIVIRKRENKRD